MEKYRVDTDTWSSGEYTSREKAEAVYEYYKDQKMADGVSEESYVELVRSMDDFEGGEVVKRANVVMDEEKMKISTPKDDGLEWDYWAKWQEEIMP
ncbi:hypothetical protein FZD47_25435 [Bacillus infantis]|uniref:Uncharacterized protein n=1 Tax=Bacillus infantis TaxID=324767 RepID=A0A5D4RWM9_9BACI|nr:hypothetical protein FZD47_25435 [Bacillus infantis]